MKKIPLMLIIEGEKWADLAVKGLPLPAPMQIYG
jgi:hypothetical protein